MKTPGRDTLFSGIYICVSRDIETRCLQGGQTAPCDLLKQCLGISEEVEESRGGGEKKKERRCQEEKA